MWSEQSPGPQRENKNCRCGGGKGRAMLAEGHALITDQELQLCPFLLARFAVGLDDL